MIDPASTHASADARIRWLDLLRACAVLLVVWGHVFLIGINGPDTVGIWIPTVTGFLFGPNTIAENPHGQFGLVLALKLGINVGYLGVSIFFLISGYVILRTVDRTTPGLFLVRRALRIFPVLWVSVALTATITYLYCVSAGVVPPQDVRGLVTSGFAAANYFGGFSTMPVLWSLTAEIVFYAIFWALSASVGRVTLNHLLGLGFACCAIASLPASGILQDAWWASLHMEGIGELLSYVTFMLVGSAIYRAQQSNRRVLYLYPALILSLWLVAYWAYSVLGSHPLGIDVPNSLWGVGIFAGVMIMKPSGSWLRPFEWVAAISYPLYLVHIPLGWLGLVVAARMGAGMHLAGIIGVASSIMCAWLIHAAVEQPSHNAGRRIGTATTPAVRLARPG
jgi:peptidoglycan/LPS O-acetylase OafA/YrhL